MFSLSLPPSPPQGQMAVLKSLLETWLSTVALSVTSSSLLYSTSTLSLTLSSAQSSMNYTWQCFVSQINIDAACMFGMGSPWIFICPLPPPPQLNFGTRCLPPLEQIQMLPHGFNSDCIYIVHHISYMRDITSYCISCA